MAEAAATRRYDPAHPFYFDASPSLLAAAPANDDGPAPVAPPWLGWPDLFKHLESRLSSEKTWRLNWWRHWGDIARFELPRRYHAFLTENDYNRGIRKDGAILNNSCSRLGGFPDGELSPFPELMGAYLSSGELHRN